MAKFLGVNKRRPKLARSQSFKLKGTWVIVENRQKLSFGCPVSETPKDLRLFLLISSNSLFGPTGYEHKYYPLNLLINILLKQLNLY